MRHDPTETLVEPSRGLEFWDKADPACRPFAERWLAARMASVLDTLNVTVEEGSGLQALQSRLGALHVNVRLALERDLEARALDFAARFFHVETWHSIHGLLRAALGLAGLHARGRRNALAIELRRHDVHISGLPKSFDGFTLLQLSDLHLDMSAGSLIALIDSVRTLQYDLCVLTGDYRADTFGPYDRAMAGLAKLRTHLRGVAYAILGNHDSIRMVPAMESIGYRLLVNECAAVRRDGETLYLAGIDDAAFFHLEDCHRASRGIPKDAVSVLLSHTPDVYEDAAQAGFDLMLCGHTHGGQICLPGGIPLLSRAKCPREFVRGPWQYGRMRGYTSAGSGASLIDVRLNCPAEVTLHRLRCVP